MSHLRATSLVIPEWATQWRFQVKVYGENGPHAVWVHQVDPGYLLDFLLQTLRWHRQMNVWQLLVACVSRGAYVTPHSIWRLLQDTKDPVQLLVHRNTDHALGMPTFIWHGSASLRRNSSFADNWRKPPSWPLQCTKVAFEGHPALKVGPDPAFLEPMLLSNPVHRRQLKVLIKDLHRAQDHVNPTEALVCRGIENYLSFYLSASGALGVSKLSAEAQQ